MRLWSSLWTAFTEEEKTTFSDNRDFKLIIRRKLYSIYEKNELEFVKRHNWTFETHSGIWLQVGRVLNSGICWNDRLLFWCTEITPVFSKLGEKIPFWWIPCASFLLKKGGKMFVQFVRSAAGDFPSQSRHHRLELCLFLTSFNYRVA